MGRRCGLGLPFGGWWEWRASGGESMGEEGMDMAKNDVGNVKS